MLKYYYFVLSSKFLINYTIIRNLIFYLEKKNKIKNE